MLYVFFTHPLEKRIRLSSASSFGCCPFPHCVHRWTICHRVWLLDHVLQSIIKSWNLHDDALLKTFSSLIWPHFNILEICTKLLGKTSKMLVFFTLLLSLPYTYRCWWHERSYSRVVILVSSMIYLILSKRLLNLGSMKIILFESDNLSKGKLLQCNYAQTITM